MFVQKGSTRYSSGAAPEVLKAPSLAKEMGADSAIASYQVVAGDSLESVARAFYGDSRKASTLAQANRIKPGTSLLVGRVLRVPSRPTELSVSTSGVVGTTDKTPGDPHVPNLRKVTKTVGKQSYEIEVSDVKRIGRPKVNRAFAVGERLKYEVRYFSVVGGTATLAVEELVTFQGRPCYRLAAGAKSGFPFSNFYNVEDRLVSLFDAVDFFSWRFEKKVREGGYRETNKTDYLQVRHRATRLKNQDPPKEFAIPPFVQDVISSFYYFRLLDFKPGDRLAVPTQAGDKNYELVVDVLKRESIQVKAGKFDCLLLKPHVKYDNVFQNKGDILLWVTADDRRMPVLIKTKILIGSINIELIEAILPKL